jgi:hypothetical protein
MRLSRCVGRLVLLFAVAVYFPRLSFAKGPGLFMAGIEMELGMPEEALVAKLQERYTLSKMSDRGWVIFEKKDPPHKIVGNIGFTGGKLSWISKEWGAYYGGETLGLAKDLFSLLSSVSESSPTPVLVQPTVAVRQPGLVISKIDLLYPDRTISIAIVESKNEGNSVSISEALKNE